ncbi:MAG TPA: DNA polymerase III subunit beta [Pseudonocardiaceae bacterium]
MEFELDRDAFADAVAWTARGLPSRPVVPVTAGVLMEVADGALSVTGFDFEVANRIEVPVTDKAGGRVLVSGRLLAEIARALPPKDVRVAVDGNRLSVRCGASRFALPLMQVEDYPAVPDLPPRSGVVASDVFASAVSQVTTAASKDETLPMLTGVRMLIEPERLVLAATDRYRLAERVVPWTSAGDGGTNTLVIPAKTLAEAAKSLGGTSEIELAMGGDTGFVGLNAGGRTSMTRLLDGDFPKFESLWPAESATTAELETSALIEGLRRVSLVAQRFAPVRLVFSDGQVALSAQAEDESSADEELPAHVVGDDLTIGFNAGYLLDGLNAIHTPRVRMSFTTGTRPTVITPVYDPDDETDTRGEETYRYLVMSMRLRG